MTDHEADSEVILGGVRIPLRGPVPDSNLKVFQGKVVFGDYQQDSDPLLSSWVMSDFSGGLGVEDMNESLDINRYKLGTLYTRYPNQISAPFKTDPYVLSAGSVDLRFLGNIKDTTTGNWDFIALLSLRSVYSAITGLTMGTLTADPTGTPVVFQGTSGVDRIIIPMGASGFATYSSARAFGQRAPGGTASAGTPALQAVVVWDNKLIGIDTSGQLWWTTNALTSTDAWKSYGDTAKLPRASTVRSLVRYSDRNGQPAVFIVTDTDVWQFDPAGPEIFSVDVAFPPHPHHGLASASWSGDLYFSVGIGIHRYTGGSLAAVGLDRDQGLPIEYAGHIVGGGLVAGYNSLFAFVTAPDLSGYTFSGSAPDPKSAVYEFTGTGWHMIWESDTEEIVPYSMGITRADVAGDAFALLWGAKTASDSHLYRLDLPIGFFNPRQKARTEGGYATSGWLITPIFDAGLKGYDKLANALDVSVIAIPAGSLLTVYYQTDNGIDDDPSAIWDELGLILAPGVTSLPFGLQDGLDAIFPGEIFQRIRFKFEWHSGNGNAFLMESAVLSFVKELPSTWSWTLEVDLTKEHITAPEVIKQHLEDLLDSGVMVPMILRGETRRVFVSQLSGSVETGMDSSSYRRVTLLEIPGSLGQAQN